MTVQRINQASLNEERVVVHNKQELNRFLQVSSIFVFFENHEVAQYE